MLVQGQTTHIANIINSYTEATIPEHSRRREGGRGTGGGAWEDVAGVGLNLQMMEYGG